MTESLLPRPSIALAAYAEALVEARRVLVYGDATSPLAQHVISRGALSVYVFDHDAARASEAAARNTSREISYAPLNDSGLALRDGAFDVAFVENLAAVGDVELALKSIRRALSVRGAALIACANPEVDVRLLTTPNAPRISIDYYSLYDAVAAQFENVRMLGQIPFVGYAIADFAPDSEPTPALDTGFVPGGAEEPEWFIALASQQSLALDEFAIVQLPFAATWSASGPGAQEDRLRQAQSAESRARQRVAALEAENKRLSRDSALRPDSEQLERLKRELERRDGWIEELEARCAAADARADQVESDLEAERERNLDQETPRIDEFESRIADLERQLETAQRQLEAAGKENSEQERELTDLRRHEAELEAQLEAVDPTSEQELVALEQQLEERGQEVLRLSQNMKKLERLSRNLVRELDELRESDETESSAEVLTLREKLDELALKNAAKEADLVALQWTVSALEGRLQAGKSGANP